MPVRLRSPSPTNPHYQNGDESEDDPHEGDGNESDAVSESGSEPSDEEIYEVPDEAFPSMFLEIGRRLYHSSPTAPYALPVDTPEQEVRDGALPDDFLLFLTGH
jgi:hypothetical protein